MVDPEAMLGTARIDSSETPVLDEEQLFDPRIASALLAVGAEAATCSSRPKAGPGRYTERVSQIATGRSARSGRASGETTSLLTAHCGHSAGGTRISAA